MFYKLVYTMSVLGLVLNATPASATEEFDENNATAVLVRPQFPLPNEDFIAANSPQPGARPSRILEISPEEMERLRVKYSAINLTLQRQLDSARKDARTARVMREKLKNLKGRSGKSQRSKVKAQRASDFAVYHLKKRIQRLESGNLLVSKYN